MSDDKEFAQGSAAEISALISGEVVEKLELDNVRMDDFIAITFKSGAILRIRYDWLYDWQFEAATPGPAREAVHSWVEDEVAYCPHCKTRYFQPRYTICQCCNGDHKLVFKEPRQK